MSAAPASREAGVVTAAPVPAQNLEAEDSVLGAILLQGVGHVALETAREILGVGDFYRDSSAKIFAAACSLADAGDPVDPITVSDRLEDRGELEAVGGTGRIHELAALVPAAGNVRHYAVIVREAARDRYTNDVGLKLQKASAAGGLHSHPELVAELEQLLDHPAGGKTLAPLWWHDAMTEEIPATTEYVDGVLQTGVLADIVGLPYLHKTAIALELATKVARGSGFFLGRHKITAQANVGYFWADDSRAKELERIQAYGDRHQLGTVPLALYLNPGIVLPDDLAAVKAEIKQRGLKLVVFDSLYNFAPGIDWTKDHAAVTTLYAALKRVCDQIEGLTIILVDHAAKPSDSNRDRMGGHSSFGSVFKAASVRCTISIEKDKGGKLHIAATGNNIRGFTRTPAFWAEEQLEVRLVDDTEVPEERVDELRDVVLDYVRQHPGESSNKIAGGVQKRRRDVAATLRQMADEGLVIDDHGAASQLQYFPEDSASQASGRTPDAPDAVPAGAYSEPRPGDAGRSGTRSAWRALDPSVQAIQPRPESGGTHPDAVGASEGGSVRHGPRPEPSPPFRGEGVGTRPEGDPEAPPHDDADEPEPAVDAHMDELERQAEDADHELEATAPDPVDDIPFPGR